MKLSKLTIDALTHFSVINSGIVIHPGNVLYTRTSADEMYGMARVPDTFELEAPIGSLREFLGIVNSYESPEVMFHEKRAVIGPETNQPTYFPYALLGGIRTVDLNRKPGIKGDIIVDKINEDDFYQFKRRGMIRKYPHVAMVIEDGELYLRSLDFKQPGQLYTELHLKQVKEEEDMVIAYTMENFNRITPGDYKIAISRRGPMQFTSEDYTFIALHVVGLGTI